MAITPWSHDWEYSTRNDRTCKKCGLSQHKETVTTGRIAIRLYNAKWKPYASNTCSIKTVNEDVETNKHCTKEQTDNSILSE